MHENLNDTGAAISQDVGLSLIRSCNHFGPILLMTILCTESPDTRIACNLLIASHV